MPKFLSRLFLCLIFASATPLAQVYQSTDAEGNKVFSDQPTPESIEVDVNQPNVADPVTVPDAPAEPPAASEPPPQPTTQEPIENTDSTYDDDDDDDYDGFIRRPRERWRRVGPRRGGHRR